ncbi:MAG TPA: hypothetical protein VF153_03800 [Candidatus Limnocylindria bacterium]
MPAPLSAALIAIPTALWASLLLGGGILIGAPVLAALALQLLVVGGLVRASSRRRPARPRRDRPAHMPTANTAA